MTTKTFSIRDLFTITQYNAICKLWKRTKDGITNTKFRDELKRIYLTDKNLSKWKDAGLDFDRDYLAYLIEYAMTNI